jgi:glycosyltransferase involved in cell wall biosynthesis
MLPKDVDVTLFDIPIFRPASLFRVPKILTYLRSKAKEENYVYGRDLLGCIISILMGFYTVFEIHSIPTNRIHRLLLKYACHHQNMLATVCISHALKEELSLLKLCKPDLLHVLPDCADVKPVTQPNFSTNGRTFRVVYVGGLYKGRGLELIFELADLLPKVEFHIYGGNVSQVASWSLNAPSNVLFHGHIRHDLVHEKLLSADALLMPYSSKVEVFCSKANTAKWMSPLKLFEYMAAFRPIISTNLPVLREVLNDKNSILVQENDLAGWRAAIENLMYSDTLRLALAHAAHEDFLRDFTWDVRARKIAALYQNTHSTKC